MSLDAGQLDRTITIQVKTVVKDTVGSRTALWGDLCTVAAQRLSLSATDVTRAVGRTPEKMAKWRIRWRWIQQTADDLAIVDDQGVRYIVTVIDAPDRRQTLLITGQAT